MKNARHGDGGRSQDGFGSNNNNGKTLPNLSAPAQAPSPLNDGIHIGRVWKSPRSKDRCISAALREFNGNNYCEFVELVMDDLGRMVPSGRRLSISTKRLGQFAALAGDAYRRAERLGLTPRST